MTDATPPKEVGNDATPRDATPRKVTITIPFSGFYEHIFTDSTTIITGCGRSGTSILGKLIGSMDGSEYIFEPTTPKYASVEPALCRAIMFEDFLLPSIQGRNINIDSETESFTGYYMTDEQLRGKWNAKRRIDVLPRIAEKKPQIVFKLTEAQGLVNQLRGVFPGARFIHIIRNGMEVIQSMMRPNWYIDAYMNTNAVDWVTRGNNNLNVPWFVSVKMDEEQWLNYNHATRCAAVWRCTVEDMLEFDTGVHVMKYERLCRYPDMETRDIVNFMNEGRDVKVLVSELTEKHINGIRVWQKSKYPNILDQIQEPEKKKFIELMQELNYM